MMKALRKGQTMVEYIIIVCLIAVSLIAVFTYLSRAIGRKAAGAAGTLSEQEGDNAKSAVENINEDSLKQLGED
jgi:Flp pilus assembly pilin Flp